ncbi:hypothetical protein THIOM_005603 [Candidatus Thiomargarita nelsonii]|uniref:Uncharacterized protein n=1 Tax=Candidatus Thiomargarita nelsonii TaxID=1003181 RepID=A0A176RSP7_9GAMM|nr:hypothetical protein THIOM_005603 [Candidatus Thiomargarita nelsonii]
MVGTRQIAGNHSNNHLPQACYQLGQQVLVYVWLLSSWKIYFTRFKKRNDDISFFVYIAGYLTTTIHAFNASKHDKFVQDAERPSLHSTASLRERETGLL